MGNAGSGVEGGVEDEKGDEEEEGEMVRVERREVIDGFQGVFNLPSHSIPAPINK